MSFIRKGLLVSGGQVFCVMLSMVVGILFSRQLGPTGMGQYELLRSLALIGGTLAAFGLGNANIFFLNSCKVSPEHIVSNAVKVVAALGMSLAIGLAIAIRALPDYFGHVPAIVIGLFALGAGAHAGRLILRPILTARLEVGRMIWVELIRHPVLLIGGVLLACFGWLTPVAAAILLALGFYGSLFLVLVFLQQYINLRRRFDWQLFRKVGVYGLKLGAVAVLLQLAQHLSIFVLRALRPGQFGDVGLYARAVAICGLILMVPRAIEPLLYAKWSSMTGQARTRQVEMAARMNTTYGLAAALIVVLAGEHLLRILYGAEFVPAQQALRILAPALVLLTFFNACNQLLASAGQAAITARILAVTVVIVCVVACLLVPGWGIRGAAFGVLSGNTFAAMAGMAVCWKLYRLRPLDCLILRWSDVTYVRKALRRPAPEGERN